MLRARQRAPVDSGDETDSSDVNLTLSESTFHEEKRKRAMSLRIYDGDLRISCGIGSERDERETSMLVEDDEFFSEDLGIDPLVSDSTDTPPLKPRVKYADSISVSSAVDVTESEEIGNISDSSDEEKPPIGNEADVHHKGDYSNRFRFENDSPHPHANEKPILSTASSIDDDFNSYPDGNLGKADDQERDILTVDSMSRSKEAREDAKDTTVTVDPYGEMKEATNDNRGAAADSVRGSKGTITDSGVSSTNSDTENKSGLSVNDESLIGNEAETKQVVCPEELLGTDDTTELSKNNSESITLNRSKTSETNRTVKDEERTPERERSVSYLEHEINRICDRLEGNPPPQNIIKCLVSLTTPRDVLSVSTQEPPAFVEFDMSHDGFAYLFLPSLTPLAATGKWICLHKVVTFLCPGGELPDVSDRHTRPTLFRCHPEYKNPLK